MIDLTPKAVFAACSTDPESLLDMPVSGVKLAARFTGIIAEVHPIGTLHADAHIIMVDTSRGLVQLALFPLGSLFGPDYDDSVADVTVGSWGA